jgi:hypothetical protein
MPVKGTKKEIIQQEMHKWKHGTLHSGSSTGPVVTSRAQAIAISLSEAKKNATKGSPPFTEAEISQGYRRC